MWEQHKNTIYQEWATCDPQTARGKLHYSLRPAGVSKNITLTLESSDVALPLKSLLFPTLCFVEKIPGIVTFIIINNNSMYRCMIKTHQT